MIKRIALLCLLAGLFLIQSPVIAQNNNENPFYTVQPGDTLSIIADKFGITINEIINLNNITNPDLISPGKKLLIPRLQGISGELTTHVVAIGEKTDVISRKYLISDTVLTKVNRLTSPNEVYAGSELIISVEQAKPSSIPVEKVLESQSLIEASVKLDLNPWFFSVSTSLPHVIANDSIYLPSNSGFPEINPISPLIKSISITPLPLAQGNTEIVKVETNKSIKLNGELDGSELHFFPSSINESFAFQGINALEKPGLVLFTMNGSEAGKNTFSYQQMLLLKPTTFLTDPPINVKDQTIDPAITKPEEDYVKSLISIITPEKLWNGKFVYPMDEPICFKSVFGNRRSYNNGTLNSFHTGLDFGVCAPSLNVYSAANGKVVFAGPLTVRGNAIFIDHGRGIFSGYFHLSQIKVKSGDLVQPRQLIGLVGSTGRVTGPHLHFEVWVNGVQVNPLDWFQKVYPQ